jgi:hypothetical protein
MHIAKFDNPHAEKVAAVLEEMLKRTRAGKMPSLLFIAEEVGREPRYGLVGRFRSDPAKALGHVTVMKEKLTDFAADHAPDIEESPS